MLHPMPHTIVHQAPGEEWSLHVPQSGSLLIALVLFLNSVPRIEVCRGVRDESAIVLSYCTEHSLHQKTGWGA